MPQKEVPWLLGMTTLVVAMPALPVHICVVDQLKAIATFEDSFPAFA
jgi:hypothetical protein